MLPNVHSCLEASGGGKQLFARVQKKEASYGHQVVHE